jgi:hypothetical protein
MFEKRRLDSNDDLDFVRATRLRRFDASSSGQRIVRCSTPPSPNGMAGSALGGALSESTPSAGLPIVLESQENPLEDGFAVPPVSLNGSASSDIDYELSDPSEGRVQPATSPTDVARQSTADYSGDDIFARELDCQEARDEGRDLTTEHAEGSALDLDSMLTANMEILQRRGGISSVRESSVSRGERRNNRSAHKAYSLPVAEIWRNYLLSLDVPFLDPRDKEASLQASQDRLGKGELAYKGLMLSIRNNADILYIYKMCYEAKFVRGQPITTFHQLRAVVGQFIRFAVVCGDIRGKDVCEAGSVFIAITNLKIVKVFISYFQLRCASSTVLSKAFNLKTLASHATTYFTSVRDEQRANSAHAVRNYLCSVCRAEKMEARKGTERMRAENSRIAIETFVTGNDFLIFTNVAKHALNGVLASATSATQASGASAISYLTQRRQLLGKWCINFLGLIVFTGSGQRPQVYASLEVPEHFDSVYREWRAGARPKLAAGMEKTSRVSGFESVVFPQWTHKYIHFHITVVREAILEMTKASRTPKAPSAATSAAGEEHEGENTGVPTPPSQALLLHTETGQPYTTSNIRYTLRRFVQYTYPELDSVTPMVIRASFATWQFRQYEDQQCFVGISQDEFVEKLAKIMNTSPEMLRSTYVAYSEIDGDQEAAMREIHRAFDDE